MATPVHLLYRHPRVPTASDETLTLQGIPVDEAMLARYPALASVPVQAPASTYTSSWKFSPEFTSENGSSAATVSMRGAHPSFA